MVKLQAHRGVSSEYPENTLAAFRASVEQGYDIIECDPKYTRDGEIVILHDSTLNRTARKMNGEKLTDPVSIHDVTLAQARELEYGSWMSPEFKGEKLPRLSDLLDFAQETHMPIKLDNVWERFPEEIRERFFRRIAERGNRINVGFTCAKPENLKLVAERFPDAALHYDGGDLSRGILEQVAGIGAGHKLFIWVCYDNDRTKWFRGQKATPGLCALVRNYGELGVWILSKREELAPAINEFGAQVIETTGHIKPEWVRTFIT